MTAQPSMSIDVTYSDKIKCAIRPGFSAIKSRESWMSRNEEFLDINRLPVVHVLIVINIFGRKCYHGFANLELDSIVFVYLNNFVEGESSELSES